MRKRTLLPLAALLAACDGEPTSPVLEATIAGLFEEGRELQVGEVLTLTAAEAQAVFLQGGVNGAQYLYVPFNASDDETAQLDVEIRGANVEKPTGPPNPSMAPALGRELLPDGGLQPDLRFHYGLREREIRELGPRVGTGSAARTSRSASASVSAALPANPRVGDVLKINANPNEPCTNPNVRDGRVVAVTDRAIVVEDVANPTGGFSQEEFRHVGVTFDTLIYPVDVFNFGVPVYPDFVAPQQRTIIFYTRVVNELTAPGSGSYVGGFFFGRDLFPRVTQAGLEGCGSSNEAPIMYLLAPDPDGEAGNKRPRDFVLRVTLATVAHEYQHLINQARRLFASPGAEPFETVWLNEGLSHIAEELMFYASSPLEPRQNITVEMIRASERTRQAFNTYQANNFGRYISYLENPDTTSLIGQDAIPTRGASWAFLRYAADQESGPDHLFFRKLVDGPRTGVPNLAEALPDPFDPIDLMQTWTVSVYTDDALPGVPFGLLYQQPSWNFRDIYSVLTGSYPLRVTALTAEERDFTLRPGGAVFVRFGIPAGGRATLITTSEGAVPGDRLRVSIVRIR